MKVVRFILLLISILLVSSPIFAQQDISVSARVDKKKIYSDSQIIYTVTVNSNKKVDGNLNLPSFKGFKAYSSGSSRTFSIVNGDMSLSKIYTYRLVPSIPGTHIIDPVTFTAGQDIYKSDSIEIEVFTGNSPARMQYDKKVTPTSGYMEEEFLEGDRDYFVELELDKKECFVNEQVTMTFKFYRTDRILADPEYEPPVLNDFWKEDLDVQKTYYEVVNGIRYGVVEIKSALFPLKPGVLDIGSAMLKINVPVTTKRRRAGFFEGFDMFTRGQSRKLRTKPLNIKVKPLPEKNKPNDFNGTVGDFFISANTDKTKLKTGEAITLKIEISGQGNINSIKFPDISSLENFEVYESEQPKTNIARDNVLVQGERIFETVLVPEKEGTLTIPVFKFSYFDPYYVEYRTISSKPITLDIEKSKNYTERKKQTIIDYTAKDITKQDITILKEDIRYMK